MRVVDMFCGMGGFSKGLEDAGYEIVCGVDLNDDALESYTCNFPNAKAMKADIRSLKHSDLPEHDLLIGSPPCQKFSQANYYDRSEDRSLIDAFKKLAEQSKRWVWENVLGSKSGEKGVVLDAQYFGVPQRRKRFFSSNKDLKPKASETSLAISDCIEIKGDGILDGFNSTIYSTDSVSPTIRRIPLKWYDGRPMQKPFRFTGFEHLSITDHLILMGFPSDWVVCGGKTSSMLQIGNAVCPPVAKAIGETLS
jgi:DNA (cytosine-5)-methyltransferase 1